MSRGGADSALVGFQHGRNHNGVGLGASGEEEDPGRGKTAGFADEIRGALRMNVRAIARQFLHIGFNESFED